MSHKKSKLWTHEKESLLIDLVKEKNFIWNPKDPMYYKTCKKQLAFEEIASNLGDEFSGQMVKERFSNMRTNFFSNMRKEKSSRKSGCSTDDVYIPSWEWYNHLHFLKENAEPGPSVSNLDLGTNSRQENLEESTSSITDVADIQPSLEAIVNNAADLSGSSECASDIPHHYFKKRGRKMAPSNSDAALAILKKIEEDEDGYTAFGRVVEHALRGIGGFKAELCKEDISKLLLDYHPANPNNSQF